MERSSPIKLVDVWNVSPELYRCQQSVKEINTILDDAENGILDSYSALCMIDSILAYHNISTHRSVTRITGSTLLSSTRDLSATRDCKSCRIIMPDDVKTDRQELLCYNGERWFKIPISKPPTFCFRKED